MREIKFRVWHIPTGRMHDYLKAKFGQHGMNITLSGKFKDVESITTLTVPNNDLRVMQYTGLKDENGIEVYEGDLMENKQVVYEVVWKHDQAKFLLRTENIWKKWIKKDPNKQPSKTSKLYRTLEWALQEKKMTVIGNIYENPELLK